MLVTSTEEKIRAMLESTNREGMIDLIGYMMQEGFFESPASTRFHGCFKGGLAEHSLGVYEILKQLIGNKKMDEPVGAGQKPFPVTEESIIIAALCHDVCKIGAYTGDGPAYQWNRKQPKGHAVLSIERISKHIKLEPIEDMMIRYHMGVYGCNEFYEGEGKDGEYPIRSDHSECEGMTKEESQAFRYGKSLANAWYHNPIVKLMYFSDELETMESKLK
jgi:23S rRNA maturation-related 3'-5' exoribonuclease YhaM